MTVNEMIDMATQVEEPEEQMAWLVVAACSAAKREKMAAPIHQLLTSYSPQKAMARLEVLVESESKIG